MFVKFHEICFKDKMFEDINDECSNSNSYRNSEIVVGASPSTYDLKIQNIVSTLLQKTIFSEVKKFYIVEKKILTSTYNGMELKIMITYLI